MLISLILTLLRRAADWKLTKVDWDQCPDPLFGRDKWSHPTVTPGIFHPAARLTASHSLWKS